MKIENYKSFRGVDKKIGDFISSQTMVDEATQKIFSELKENLDNVRLENNIIYIGKNKIKVIDFNTSDVLRVSFNGTYIRFSFNNLNTFIDETIKKIKQ